MEYLSVIIGITTIFLIGYILLRVVSVSLPTLEKIGLSFGLGTGVVSFQMFLYIFIGLKLSALSIIAPWFVIGGIYTIFFLKEIRITTNLRLSLFSKMLICLILLTIVYVFIQSQMRPLYAWDAVANWSFLSKAVFVDKTISGELYQFANFDIPYLVSFQEAFIYFIHGSVIDKTVLLIFPVYFVCILMLFYSVVRTFLSTQYSLLFTFLLASLPNLMRQAGTYDLGYVDIALSYYIFASVVLFLKIRKKDFRLLWILGCFLGFTTLVKGEGQGFAGIVFGLTIFTLYTYHRLGDLIKLLPGICIFLIWKYFGYTEQFPLHYLYTGTWQFQRLPTISVLLLKEFIYITRWNLLWVISIVSLVYLFLQKKVDVVVLILVLQLFFYMGIYSYTPIEVSDHIVGSLDRFLLQVSPLAMYMIAYTFSEITGLHEKN